MCGVAGIIASHVSSGDKMADTMQRMTNAIAHRGPDGAGFWMNKNGNVSLGHRRLKIIDLSDEAAQPMHYLDRYSITYNGEIYNYIELKNELATKGYFFKTQSDTEVILAAYDAWKEACLLHFDGMFAFAIWDEQQQQLFCARDRFGEKPFYFFENEKQFLFASEMKALWAIGVEKKAKNAQLLNYITLGFVQNVSKPAETFFENIFILPPGHYIILKLPLMEKKMVTYWDIDKETINHSINEKQVVEEFSTLLYQSVERRLRSDVGCGASISGGLDSSSIVSMIHSLKNTAPQLQTFSAVFPGFEKDESKYIQEVVEKFHIKNFKISPQVEDLVNNFDRLMYHQEEPFQSLSIYAQYQVYQLAKQQHTTVVLDGQGADEILAGYHKYYHWYWQDLIANRQWGTCNNEIKAAKNIGVQPSWNWKNKLAALAPAAAAGQLEKKAHLQQKKYHSISTDFLEANYDRQFFRKPIVRKLNDILYFNVMQSGLQELLRYADRNSMSHGVEVRLPFLNHELVQFVFSLPSSFKIKNGFTKWILRKSMNEHLPKSIAWRNDKIGYEPPQQQWMQHKIMKEKIMESRKKLVGKGILQPSIMQQPISAKAAHQEGNDDFRYLCIASII